MLKVLAYLTTLVRRDDRGVTAVEYALLLLFVAAALIVSLKLWGAALGGVFDKAATDI